MYYIIGVMSILYYYNQQNAELEWSFLIYMHMALLHKSHDTIKFILIKKIL